MLESNEQHLSPGWSDGQSGASNVPPTEQRADGANTSAAQSSTNQPPPKNNPSQNTARDSRSEARR